MPKNNLSQNQFHFRKDPPVKNWPDVSFKLVFTAMMAVGVFSVNPALFKLSNGSKPATSNNVAAPQLVLAIKPSNIPDPSLLAIPSLKITAPFESLGLNANRTIEVPKNYMGVGWFVYGAKPGEVGASVVVGHLDSVWGSAVFANLSKIKPGDEIFITRTDDSIVTYRVDSIQKFSQSNFPTKMVYGFISYPGLRLITCSGTWDKRAGHYSDNLVVFATEI